MMKSKKLTQGLFVFYLVALTWIILFKMQFSVKDMNVIRNINWIPFGASMVVNGRMNIGEIINNAAAFVPFGVFAGMLQQNKNLIRKIAPILIVSLLVETLQFLLAIGASDITDIITNTLGGIIGIGIYLILTKIFKEKVNKVINIIALLAATLLAAFLALLIISNL